jgi:hypothetical protein
MTHPQSLYRVGRGETAPAAKPWWKANEGKPGHNTDFTQRAEEHEKKIAIQPIDPYGA